MSNTTRILRWTVINGLFMTAVLYGFVDGVEWAKNVATFWIWITVGMALFLFFVTAGALSVVKAHTEWNEKHRRT